MLQPARLDAGPVDEGVHLALLEADDPAELVRRQLALVDEPVQRPHGDAQPARRLAGTHPVDVDGGHSGIIKTTPHVQCDARKGQETSCSCPWLCSLIPFTMSLCTAISAWTSGEPGPRGRPGGAR